MSDPPRTPRVLLRSADSGGEVSVIETAPRPGGGPRLHRHDFDEALYVMAGELVFAPRGVRTPTRTSAACRPTS
jgi:quercetin dioxygenase-like cupin family protein